MEPLERLKTITQSWQDVSPHEYKDYGILVPVSNIVIYQLPPRHDRKIIDASVLRKSPVWLTTFSPDSGTHYIIDKTGNQSSVGLNLKQYSNYPHISVPDLGNASALLIDHRNILYLFLTLRDNDWKNTIAPVVSGWRIVSGMDNRSGPFRDILTAARYEDNPFSE